MLAIVLRFLINTYINQQIPVKWNDSIQERSNIKNRVKQGGCLSPIDVTLGKRCNKCSWNLINSKCKLYNNIVKLSLNNVTTTIDDNMRYFMYEYKIQENDWYNYINIIYKKIDNFMLLRFNVEVQ